MRIFTTLACLLAPSAAHNISSRIVDAATVDGINLYSLPFAVQALASIQDIYSTSNITVPVGIIDGNKFDVHMHVVPSWYRAAVPLVGGFPTPDWTLEAHLSFMASAGIKHGVLSMGTPGTVVYPGDQVKSAAVARLLNEYLAALVHILPEIFSFFAVAPLPYTEAAITETTHALNHLNASGINLQSNHEGFYLGNAAFKPLFAHLNNSFPNPTPIFVHPAGPCLHAPNGTIISANPTLYPSGLVEFYFETARTFMDLTVTQTLTNFTSLKWIVPHAGGAFPAIEDRFLTSQPADFQERSREAFATRVFWDVAGPVFPKQIWGLLGYGVPVGQVLYGSDFPYAPNFTYEYEIAAIGNVSFLTDGEKVRLFAGNHEALFGGVLTATGFFTR